MIYKISIQTKDLKNLESITKELARLSKLGLIKDSFQISELFNDSIRSDYKNISL
jgi:hypothetical protein